METPVTDWIGDAFERGRDKSADKGRLNGIKRTDEINERKRAFEHNVAERFGSQLVGFEELGPDEQKTRIRTIRSTIELGDEAAGEYNDTTVHADIGARKRLAL